MRQDQRGLRPRRRLGFAGILSLVLTITLTGDALAISWVANRTVAGGGTAWASPGSLAVSTSTIAHAVFEQGVVGTFGAFYRRTNDSGSTWSTPFRLSRGSIGEAGAPSIDAYGNAVDAVWLESDDILAGLDTVLLYRRSMDQGLTWGAPIALSPAQESAGMPRIARRGALVVVTWTDEATGRIYARTSTDSGVTWKARILLASTTRRLGARYEGFPVVAVGTGIVYVAYYSAAHTLRLRRSTSSGATWSTAITIATNGDGWDPSLAAYGSTAVLGFAASTSSDVWTVIRRTTDKGAHWGSVVALSPSSSYPSFSPVLSVRGTRWMALYERCSSNTCAASDVYYRASTNSGSTWSTASKVSVRKRTWAAPADVDVATKTIVLYVDYNSKGNDVYLRQGS